MGGTDQKFNLLVGRELQRDYGQPPQIVATVPILEGLDGVEKMSKSKGNYIGITEPPKVMFRKVMQICDDLMCRYYELLTDACADRFGACAKSEPMRTKMDTWSAHRERISIRQETPMRPWKRFDREVRQGRRTGRYAKPSICRRGDTDKGIRVDKLLAQTGLADSVTDAARKLKAGAVEINGEIHKELLLTGAAGRS